MLASSNRELIVRGGVIRSRDAARLVSTEGNQNARTANQPWRASRAHLRHRRGACVEQSGPPERAAGADPDSILDAFRAQSAGIRARGRAEARSQPEAFGHG